MKNSLILLLLIPSIIFAQKPLSEKFYLFDAKMQGVSKIDSAAFLMRISKFADTLWQFDTYKALGPLTSSEQYRDADATMPSGVFTFYHPTGYIDSTGKVINGLLDGNWSYYNDSGKVLMQKTYAMGKLTKTRDFLKEEKEKTGKEKTEKDDSLEVRKFNRVEWESEYTGGLAGWKRYIEKNIRYPQRAISYQITGSIIVQFIINTEGKPTEATLFKSVEYSVDTEAKRIILASNKWKPAFQDGRRVKSYKRQPIVFNLK
ncbi:MAG: TonB family protein [Chitinophagaceae bacterium]|nr:MAG: TonB family protein [Chitinophagaceae bacterium]